MPVSYPSESFAEWTKIAGAGVAFLVAWYQYWLAQRWKRREFLAGQIKDLESDDRFQAALTMLDWSGRPVLLRSNKTGTLSPKMVNEATLTRALFSFSPPGGFTDTEASIRDCFDRFLDGLSRLRTFVEARLIYEEEVKNYIEYWISKTTYSDKLQHGEEFYVLLHMYVDEFGFKLAGPLMESYGVILGVSPAKKEAVLRALKQQLEERYSQVDESADQMPQSFQVDIRFVP